MSDAAATTADVSVWQASASPSAGGNVVLTDEFGLVGSIIDGRYLVEAPSGQGGFGLVYRARHLLFGTAVAVKVLRAPARSTAAELHGLIEHLSREGRVLLQLGALHPCIVRVLEAGTVSTARGVTGYLAMEWLEGCTLATFLETRRSTGAEPYSVTEMLALLGPLVDGLALAHDRGVCHRDIKPSNVFMVGGAQPSLKLLDFGLAKVADVAQGRSDESSAEMRRFTRAYAAPEQWSPSLGRTGPHTDVFALALLCAELLSGVRALSGDQTQIVGACLDPASRPTPRRLGAATSEQVDGVFRRALAVSPSERFSDARAFWTALSEAAQTQPRAAWVSRGTRWTAAAATLLLAVTAFRLFRAAPSPASKPVAATLAAVPVWGTPPSVSALAASATRTTEPPRAPAAASAKVARQHPKAQPVPSQVVATLPAPSASAPSPEARDALQDLFQHEQLSRRK